MSLAKKDIAINISNKAQISRSASDTLVESFINIIKSKSVSNVVKISNFGSFYLHYSPQRIGRNPKTMEEFVIPKQKKLVFKASNSVKNNFN